MNFANGMTLALAQSTSRLHTMLGVLRGKPPKKKRFAFVLVQFNVT
jgi:hypothetical protein